MTTSAGLPFTIQGQLPDEPFPVMIVMLSGWIDASGAAAGAMEHLVTATESERLIEFDGDTFIDYRVRRPIMELRDGVNTRIVWTCPEIRTGIDSEGHNLLLLTGPEPDSAWRHFANNVAALAKQLGVEKMIGMGAYPYGSPHTRPVGMSATSPNLTTIARLAITANTLDAPAGVTAILEHAMVDIGIDAMSMWAQIPHYVATMAYPAASATLIDAVCLEAGLSIDSSPLRREAGVQRERLDALVSGNPEHAEMLSKLEAAYDAVHGTSGTMTPDAAAIPSIDEIAAEVEQFLRDQQTGGQP
jgi:proteasome assembly chaperone (PAC2) family protein